MISSISDIHLFPDSMFCLGGMQSPRRRNREKSILLTIFIVCAIYFIFYADTSKRELVYDDEEMLKEIRDARQASAQKPLIQKDMVVASMQKDNISWLFEEFPDWHKNIYVVDDPNADLTVPQNKGRESMVYLT